MLLETVMTNDTVCNKPYRAGCNSVDAVTSFIHLLQTLFFHRLHMICLLYVGIMYVKFIYNTKSRGLDSLSDSAT